MAVDKTKLHDRQVEHRSNLPRISDQEKPTLKELLPQIDKELTPVFELRESITPDLVLNIGPGDILNSDTGLARSFSPINQQFFKFSGGTVTFPATSGNPILVSPGLDNELIMPNDTYLAILVQINSIGDLSISLGLPVALEADTLIVENFPVPNKKDLPIGYVTLYNNAGTIQPISNEKIVQFESGGGGGGAGDANELLERLKNRLANYNAFEYLTPVIFSTVEEDLTDELNTTAEYSVANSSYSFPLIGNQFVSVQMLDPEFLAEEIGVDQVELVYYWDINNLDSAATYEVSRDGGNEYQAITMDRIGQSDTYRGIHTFAQEATDSFTQSVGGAVTGVLDFTDINELSRQFTLANTTTVKKVVANITKTGAATGYIYAVAVKDDGFGSPSTDPLDKIGQSSFISIDGLSVGVNAVDFNVGFTATAEDYHIIFKTDSVYQTDYTNSVGARKVAIDEDGTSIVYQLSGLELDLRVRVTSGTDEVSANGFGIFYKRDENVTYVDGSILRYVETFVGDVDNLSEFTINFTPDVRLMTIYELGTGQAYRYGAWVIDANGNIVFPANTFNKPGTVTLEFLQVQGGSFDNSDRNQLVLAGNHLGSLNPNLDFSVADRGIHLRSANGTLYEIVVKDGGVGFDIYEVI